MKHLILPLFFLSFLFSSCSKSSDVTGPLAEGSAFSLSLQIENDVDCTYKVESSLDGVNFKEKASFVSNPANNGNYFIDLVLQPREMVRIKIVSNLDNAVSLSDIVTAY